MRLDSFIRKEEGEVYSGYTVYIFLARAIAENVTELEVTKEQLPVLLNYGVTNGVYIQTISDGDPTVSRYILGMKINII